MRYVDGYVLPIAKKKLPAYKKMASLGAKVWKDHGALQYVECAGEDLAVKFGLPFTKQFKTRPGETIVFAFIVFKSRKHRDQVNARVMKDKRMQSVPEMPFDPKRTVWGGFETLVDL